MEVHTHTHPAPAGTARKKWTHHFWEFLMLFLAVFCGFLAEYQLEHTIEKDRERVYIKSMVVDLKQDTAVFSSENVSRRQAINMYDSLITLLIKKERNTIEQQRIYYLARMSLRLSPFPNQYDRTYDQMKSSGNLRLIHNEKIADKITSYYFKSKEFSVSTSQIMLRLQSLIDYQGKIFDGAVFQGMIDLKDFSINAPVGNPPLMTEDKKMINELVVRLHYVLSILLYSENFVTRMKTEASQLIEVLEKEYDLD
jgi:hypothetical protein